MLAAAAAVTLVAGIGVASAGTSALRSASPAVTWAPPPANASFDYQIGEACPPPAGVTVVSRDHDAAAAPGLYNICYETVGAYPALLTHDAGGVTLDVDVTDWNATLELTVGRDLTISDADLLRFAAGVHILNRSNPQ